MDFSLALCTNSSTRNRVWWAMGLDQYLLDKWMNEPVNEPHGPCSRGASSLEDRAVNISTEPHVSDLWGGAQGLQPRQASL